MKPHPSWARIRAVDILTGMFKHIALYGDTMDEAKYIEEELTKVLIEAHNKGREEEREANLKLAESLKWKGDYKDCPAAWITACYDQFEKLIRNRSTKTIKERD